MPRRQRHTLKAKDAKKFLAEASKRLGTDIEKLLGAKTRVEINQTQVAELFIINGRPLLAKLDGDLFPTLSFKEILPLIPQIVVDMGAVPYVCKGADIMAPGVRTIKDDFKENDLVLIIDERHGKPLAIGISLSNSEEMRTRTSGKIVKNLHYVGDKLWNSIKS
jgi:PUA-domain protein